MVQLHQLAVALAIGPAAAVPAWGLPGWTDPFTDVPTWTDLPFGLGSSSSSTSSKASTSSSTKASAASSVASSLVSSGASKAVSTPVSNPSAATPVSSSVSKAVSSPVSVSSAPTPVSSGVPKAVSTPVSSGSSAGSTSKVASSGISPVSPVKVSTKTSSATATPKAPSTGVSKPYTVLSKPASSGVSIKSTGASSGSSIPKSTSTTGSSALPTVSTTSGDVIGHPAPNTTDTYEYLGIQFGQAPVGDLRFAPPVAYTGSGTFNGSSFGKDCPFVAETVPVSLGPRLYTLLGDLAQVNSTFSEDCLFLNVWAPAGATNLPVMLWIYGGGFTFGGSDNVVYNGRHLADDEDVIVVSFNYRTNIFGFPGAPNITQNVGLLDQRLAVEWVRDNIAAFGGNPDLITLFGQSAGGASTDLYAFTWYDDPIIAGAIPMSGTADSFGDRTLAESEDSWNTVTTDVGCGNSSNTAADVVLACMRSANTTFESIVTAAAPAAGLGSLLGNFGPTIDDTIVFSNYTERAVDGYVANVPVLTGNLNYESGLFILIAAGAGEGYPQSTWDYIDQQIFTCPVSRVARYRTAVGIPAWRYYYSAGWPNLILPTANLTQAWHTSELPLLFGDAEEVTAGTANTANETALGNYMRSAWATFAANPTSGLSDVFGWPQYSSGLYVGLGQNNETSAAYFDASLIEDVCAFP